MANLQRRNHFLPEGYQQGFTDSTGKVWVLFADKRAPEHRNPRTVGRLRSFYIRKVDGADNDQIEQFFGKHVDDPFAVLSQKIKNEQSQLSTITGQELGPSQGSSQPKP